MTKQINSDHAVRFEGWNSDQFAAWVEAGLKACGGKSFYWLHQQTGISESLLRKYKKGDSTPGADKLLMIAHVIGDPIADMFQPGVSYEKQTNMAASEVREEGAEERHLKYTSNYQQPTNRHEVQERMTWARDTVLEVMQDSNSDVTPRVSEVLSMMLYQGTITEEGLVHLMDAFARDLK